MATRTAAEQRAEAKLAYDAFLAGCPTRTVMETIGDKWSGLVVTALADGPKRHGELRRVIAGVSQKMLTQTLRTLERDGLVDREVTAQVPVRVDYALTPLGETLVPVLGALKDWSELHMDRILAAREAFDEQGALAPV
ncbi:HxlR family transcriptional regulator [Motilibacter rhizosphaerae]|uniref:HxlR family transcriptional regulator n=1 Tax=Motilibacter rhizosphaerae TaxID=598652 RepID=A0A4Q7NGE2_9ACTN|nr:helix-turn-helix domain-containing protein [Motilibacter rhizosphaerae]RZS82854.1 HxlR family transcriptional regulator [Motilibacter rhizosphaerae]